MASLLERVKSYVFGDCIKQVGQLQEDAKLELSRSSERNLRKSLDAAAENRQAILDACTRQSRALLDACEQHTGDIREDIALQRREMRKIRLTLETLFEQNNTFEEDVRHMLAEQEQAKKVMAFAEAFSHHMASLSPQTAEDGILKTKMAELLAFYGLTMVDETGIPFNPDIHQACDTVSLEEVEDSIVVQIIRPGFLSGNSLLQPALVVVNRREPNA